MQLGLFFGVLAICATFSAEAQVYRCGNSYSSSPCHGGREVNVSDSLVDPAGPKSVRIYLCKRPDDRLFWLHERCANRGWTLDRVELVPKNLNWEDQIEYARSKKNRALADAAPTVRSAEMNTSASPAASNKASECSSLEERINWLDSLGRAGGGGYTMDWIREERRIARDKQFRLRC